MRMVGLVLVALGALALGLQGFGFRPPGGATSPAADGEQVEGGRAVWVPPVVSGIMVVGGLLLLATDARRD